MSRPIKRPQVILTAEERKMLEKIRAMRTEEKCRVDRADMLLKSADGMGDTAIAREMSTTRAIVNRCVMKCVDMGVETALNDLHRSGAKPVIGIEEKGWIVFLACEKPTSLGYPNELWTITLLLNHIHKYCEGKGYAGLKSLSRSKLWNILNGVEVKPHKIGYYLERKDPEFEKKMNDVLVVYKEVAGVNKLLEEQEGYEAEKVTISYDEKPGIQALGRIAPDLPPQPYQYKAVGRDYEYKRHGTLSLLAGIDLHDGTICIHISKTHKSSDFIEFLKKVNNKYPKEQKIRIILDNHSAHTSKETRAYLGTVPNRFEFVFTPTHGSWLNIIETFFSKMTRTLLRGIRVTSDVELAERITNYIDEVNEMPVVFRWKYKMNESVQ